MAPRVFAFIRAINTGGRRLTNAQLLHPFRAAGLDDVDAYQAAGNVAFRSGRAPAELERELHEALSAAYGFDAPVFVRSATELRPTVTEPPFPAEVLARATGKMQITFMASAPSATQIDDALALVPAGDHVVFVDREWLWLPVAGVGESNLPVTGIERIVGAMTMRTVGTVERMLARFGD
ncbi:MAG TPA: DUF1697 domain-containing protein [Ilumatobacteraceae bacterium]|nr:DUF1697 domain-containing protein [Ilumatobacteraceae bacterium]